MPAPAKALQYNKLLTLIWSMGIIDRRLRTVYIIMIIMVRKAEAFRMIKRLYKRQEVLKI